MSIEKIVRNQAREKLKGSYPLAIAALFSVFALLMVVFLAMEIVLGLFNVWDENGVSREGTELVIVLSELGAVAALVLLSPAKNGLLRIFFKTANGDEAEYSDLFYYFKQGKYLVTLGFNLILALKKLVTAFVCFIPYIALSIVRSFDKSGSALYDILGVILITAAISAFILRALKYLISDFIYIDNDKTDFSAIYSVTNHIFKRHRGDVYMLWCSFLPWLGLCFFVLPAFFVIPYALTSAAVSSKWLLKIYKDGKMI